MSAKSIRIEHFPPDDDDANRIIEKRQTETWFNAALETGKHEPFSFFSLLTPARAKFMLANNPQNRKGVRASSLLKRFIRAIEDDRWQVNGETVIVAKTGEMNDGQTRCQAVIATGKSITTCFVFGVDRESRISIDTGGARTIGQMLQMHEMPSGNNLGAAVHLLMTYEKTGKFTKSHADVKPDHQEILTWINDVPEVIDDIRDGETVARAVGGRTTCFGAIVTILKGTAEADAVRFFDALKDGSGMPKGHPIFTLRERLLKLHRIEKKKATDEMVAALTFKSWNAYRQHRKVATLSWKDGEKFPVPV